MAPGKFCINLFGTMWAKDVSWIDDFVINHELIHTRQMKELLYVPFYIIYVCEWIGRLIQYKNKDLAYRNISFEREAYDNGNNLAYLASRKPYSWIRYLKNN